MNKSSLLFLFILITGLSGYGQNWVNLSSGIDWGAKYFFADTVDDLLYVSGNFEYADSIHVNQIASWNGTQWDSLGPGMTFGGAAYGITSYQNKLYVSGLVTNDLNHFFASWNGIVWDTTGLQIDGASGAYIEYNGDLIVGGNFSKAGNQPANFLAQYDGNSWNSFPTSSWQGGGIFALANYNNEIYCGGNFYDTGNSISRLCKWNGSSFIPLGNLTGGFTAISCMIVFQNELYIGGYFTPAMGAVSNYIMKWNGSSFTPVGLGTNSTVRCMKEYNHELYVGGDFDTVGGTYASSIAKWNGVSWQPVSSAHFDGGIQDIAFYHDQLYVLGGFHHIDSDSINYLAKWNESLKIDELFESNTSIYPTPTTNEFTLDFSNVKSKDLTILISNIFGQSVREYRLQNNNNLYKGNLENLQDGIYFLTWKSDNIQQTFKLIKSE